METWDLRETPSEERARVFGTFDTSATRSRKGRRSFKVTTRRARRMRGVTPFLPDSSDGDVVHNASVDLVALADAWIARFHPEEMFSPCTCDDLTHRVIVLDRETHAPMWDTAKQRYVTADVIVRRCHCQRFPHLLGTDYGLSWEELTPDPRRLVRIARAPRAPRDTNAAARRKRAERRASAPVPVWQPEADVLSARLAETDAPVVDVDFPGVKVTVRRDAGTRWAVTIVRGDETVRMRARTVGPIARAITA